MFLLNYLRLVHERQENDSKMSDNKSVWVDFKKEKKKRNSRTGVKTT